VHADQPGPLRPAVRLELEPCLDGQRDAIRHAVRVELGEPAAADDPSALAVHVACAADGPDAGVVIEVRPAGSSRRYRYALDWHAQPLDARPRLLGLAVAEAVDASRIELTAVPEPLPATRPGAAVAPPARAARWTIALVGQRRAFSASAGIDVVGAGLAPARRLSHHLHLVGDVLIEGATVLSETGAVTVRSVSSAPHIAFRAGRRLHAEVGLGARIGVVHMRGAALPNNRFTSDRLARLWLGPTATASLGADLTATLALRACFELGVVATGATARDTGEPVAVVDGTWTSFGLAAVIAL
jgi:hypothetical protein